MKADGISLAERRFSAKFRPATLWAMGVALLLSSAATSQTAANNESMLRVSSVRTKGSGPSAGEHPVESGASNVPDPSPRLDDGKDPSVVPDPGSPSLKPTAVVAEASYFARHLQFLSAEAGGRFRYVDKGIGKVTDRDVQYKISTRVRVNLIGDGVTYVQARGESGRSFTSSYDYTNLGLNRGYWSFNMKSLFIGQRLGSHIEADAGGVEYNWGAGTEATYADNDGWLEGYRLRYTGKVRWLPDEISSTIGYAGDFSQPNFISRINRMTDENYIQILAAKQLSKNLFTSAEFDSIQGIRYSREALHWQRLPLVLVDELSVEAIPRASDNPTFGWSGSLFRTPAPTRWMRLGVFYSDMPSFIFLKGKTTIFCNGDSYALGKRIGPTLRVIPFGNFEVNLMGSSRLDNTPGMRYRGQIAIRYQFANLLNRGLR